MLTSSDRLDQGGSDPSPNLVDHIPLPQGDGPGLRILRSDRRLILPPTCGYLLGRGGSPLPRRTAMSPIVIIVFAPVVIIGLVCYALLLGAAAAGTWEAVEERTHPDD
jgi:hypothetical protein